MIKIKAKHEELQKGYKDITSEDRAQIYDQVQALKGRSFDTGCTTQNGEFRFNVTYSKPPKVILNNNGILVNSTQSLGRWKQNVDYSFDKEFIKIKSIKPAAQEIHICWLAFPDLS